MKKIITLFLLATLSTGVYAQKAQMLFYGVIAEGILSDPTADENSKNRKQKPIKDVKVSVFAAGELVSTHVSKETGFYGVLLKSGGSYEVVFEKDGYFSKTYVMNCKKLEHPADGSALKCLIDIDLFKSVDQAELTDLSKKPYGICSVNRNEFVWDTEAMHKHKVKFFELAQPAYLQNEK
jgi:hypothetical protein